MTAVDPALRATRTACPYCGDRLLAPEVSEFVDGGEIRHHWSCDSCGGELRTSIELTAH